MELLSKFDQLDLHESKLRERDRSIEDLLSDQINTLKLRDDYSSISSPVVLSSSPVSTSSDSSSEFMSPCQRALTRLENRVRDGTRENNANKASKALVPSRRSFLGRNWITIPYGNSFTNIGKITPIRSKRQWQFHVDRLTKACRQYSTLHTRPAEVSELEYCLRYLLHQLQPHRFNYESSFMVLIRLHAWTLAVEILHLYPVSTQTFLWSLILAVNSGCNETLLVLAQSYKNYYNKLIDPSMYAAFLITALMQAIRKNRIDMMTILAEMFPNTRSWRFLLKRYSNSRSYSRCYQFLDTYASKHDRIPGYCSIARRLLPSPEPLPLDISPLNLDPDSQDTVMSPLSPD